MFHWWFCVIFSNYVDNMNYFNSLLVVIFLVRIQCIKTIEEGSRWPNFQVVPFKQFSVVKFIHKLPTPKIMISLMILSWIITDDVRTLGILFQFKSWFTDKNEIFISFIPALLCSDTDLYYGNKIYRCELQ